MATLRADLCDQAPAPRRARHTGLLKSPLFHLALIALVGVLAYANTFQVPFVIDDEGSILENPVVKDLYSFLLEGEGFRYNPRRFVGYLTLALNYRLGGGGLFGYHLFNLALHLLNACLVYALASCTFSTPIFSAAPQAEGDDDAAPLRAAAIFLPLFAALFFVAHPIQTQAVTYVVQRFASLATLFYLGSLLCYLKGRLGQEKTGSPLKGWAPLFYFGSLSFALLALFTKEISFTLPAALLLYEFSFFGATWKKLRRLLLPAAALVLAVAGLALSGGGVAAFAARLDAITRETDTISRGDYLLTQFSVLVTYLRLIFLPVGQNLDYDYPVYRTLFAPRVLLSFLLLAMLLLCALRLYRKREAGAHDPVARIAGFGILWFFVTASVESSVIPIRDVIFEHRVYLPSFGLFCSIAALLSILARRLRGPALVRGAWVAVLFLAVLTFQRNQVWGSSAGLWRDCAEKAPRKLRPRNNLANALVAEGRAAEAVEQLKMALTLAPGDPATLRNLGAAYERLGSLEQAIELYQRAIRANPADKYARYNLGIAYSKKGLAQPALAEFQAAIRIDPGYAQAHNNLGVLYAQGAEMRRAADEFRMAARLDPGSAEAHLNLGRALGELGDAAGALAELVKAAALEPENAEVYNCIGMVYAASGCREEAAKQFRRAAALMPGEPRYTDNLYRLRLQGG